MEKDFAHCFSEKINLGEINQIEINVPSLEEQTKIGTFFQNLDQLITLHQRKLDLLKETKKDSYKKCSLKTEQSARNPVSWIYGRLGRA
ncbi:restriction endonuclease subunit S [Enterococcus lactis]